MSSRIGRLLYQPLVDFDDSQRPVPRLARWEKLTPQRYRFHIDEAAAPFSTGRKVTVEDVVATYAFVLDPDNGSPHRSVLSVIERMEPRGESVVDFVIARPDAHFPAYLTVGIVPAESLQGVPRKDTPPPGNGPFIADGGDGRTTLRLVRRRDGQAVELVAARDPLVRLLKLLRGEVHLVQNDLPPELFGYLASEAGINVVSAPGTNFSYLGFNLEDPVTGDPRVRRAIAHAIDREAIIRHLFRGRATLASSLFPPTHWLGLPLEDYPHDIGRARKLLADAGFTDESPLHLEYKTSSDPFRLRVATILQAQLAQAGIRLELRSYDWGTFYGDIKTGNFQMYSLAWVGMKTPDSFRYLFHSGSVPPEGANRGRYRSDLADRLIEAGEAATDTEEGIAYYRRLQQLLLDELPYVPLWYEDNVLAIRDEVTGYRLAPDGNYDGLAHTGWSSR